MRDYKFRAEFIVAQRSPFRKGVGETYFGGPKWVSPKFFLDVLGEIKSIIRELECYGDEYSIGCFGAADYRGFFRYWGKEVVSTCM
ncbi:MAG: hypothetical protein A2007_01395 [Verrucomicrobia bacterium GWC2_42_7]|nr:MAG: hypothetical protein A2007_01395 [Verrucomicrobia bacterium GWC2_42_7]